MSIDAPDGYVYDVRYKFTGTDKWWHYRSSLQDDHLTLTDAVEVYNILLPRVGKYYAELELVERPPLPKWAVIRNAVAGSEPEDIDQLKTER